MVESTLPIDADTHTRFHTWRYTDGGCEGAAIFYERVTSRVRGKGILRRRVEGITSAGREEGSREVRISANKTDRRNEVMNSAIYGAENSEIEEN